MTIKVKQSATPAGSDWWKWAVWIEGDDEELRAIDSVKYTLHPTFPNPVRVVKSRGKKFRLESGGWGEFDIHVELCYKDGRVSKRKHWLRLEEGAGGHIKAKVKKQVKKILPGAEEAGGERRAVFISSSAADMPLAMTLGKALGERGVEVLTAEDPPPGLPWHVHLNSQLQRADNAIFFLSERTSRWLTHEIKAVRSRDLPITTVVVAGHPVEVPPDLTGPGIYRVKIKPMPAEASCEQTLEEMRTVAKRLVRKIFPSM